MPATRAATMRFHVSAPAPLIRPGAWPNGGKSVSAGNPTGPGSRGPYRLKNPVRSYESRLAERMAPQPPCRCECGEGAAWGGSRAKWQQYAKGHRRPHRLHWDHDWLYREYVTNRRTFDDIGVECGVDGSAVAFRAKKLGIPARNPSEAHRGRQAGEKNPAWRGGVADWDYTSDWKVIARSIRNRDEWRCALCHEQRRHWGKNLHVHHINGDKLNNEPTNLISVCAACHPRGAREQELAPLLTAIVATRGGGAQ